MYRTIGCLRTTRIGDDGVFTKAAVVQEGTVLTLPAENAEIMRWCEPHAFVDLTIKSMFAESGIEIPHRHALFYTQPCPVCSATPNAAANRRTFTVCMGCGNSRRQVWL